MKRKSLLQNVFAGVYSAAKKRLNNPYAAIGLSTWRVKILKHLPGGKLRKWRIGGKQLLFNSPEELIHGLKEIFVDKIYEQTLPPNAYILDCGANIGLSVIYFKRICPSAHIIAFEPDPLNFEILNYNLRSFQLDKVEVNQAAIWKEKTRLTFSSTGSMGSSLSTTDPSGIEVPTVRLKDLLVRPVDFLKLDIEGAEYEVIRDAADALAFVKTMFVEYHGRFDQNQELLEILAIIQKAGFRFYLREASPVYPVPFKQERKGQLPFDVQLNIFCIRD